jgi:hypothetical protein
MPLVASISLMLHLMTMLESSFTIVICLQYRTLSCDGFSGTNTLAYLNGTSVTATKGCMRWGPARWSRPFRRTPRRRTASSSSRSSPTLKRRRRNTASTIFDADTLRKTVTSQRWFLPTHKKVIFERDFFRFFWRVFLSENFPKNRRMWNNRFPRNEEKRLYYRVYWLTKGR